MAKPDVAEHLPIKPLRLILGLVACIGIAATLFTLLFGFMTIPANSVGVRTRFGAYHDIVNPGLTHAIPYVDEIHIVATRFVNTLTQTGFYTFNRNDKVISFDLSILNLGAATDPKSASGGSKSAQAPSSGNRASTAVRPSYVRCSRPPRGLNRAAT